MPDIKTISLDEILDAFRYALNLSDHETAANAERSWDIAAFLGRKAGLSLFELWELRCVVLLKGLGFGASDWLHEVYFDQMSKPVPGGGFEKVDLASAPTLARSLGVLSDAYVQGASELHRQVELFSFQGAKVVNLLRFSDRVAEAITHFYDRWDGCCQIHGGAEENIPIYSRIALLAQAISFFKDRAGENEAIKAVGQFSGHVFDPSLASMFLEAVSKEHFWRMLEAQDVEIARPYAEFAADEAYLDDIAVAFGLVIDAKSSFTSGHSTRVALYTDLIAIELGLSERRRRWLWRCALLHDVGKLGVSNAILDKPGKLNDEEWTIMRDHARHSENILSRIPVFEEISAVASAHHERLDGKGYPNGLAGDEVTLEMRIISVADIFDALTAARPYRPAMDVETALSTIEREVGSAVDPKCFTALKKSIGPVETFSERFAVTPPPAPVHQVRASAPFQKATQQ